MKNVRNKKSLFYFMKDVSLNMISNMVVIGVTQLILYPLLTLYLGNEKFGAMLTVMGLFNSIAIILGSTLNNVRLLVDYKYKENKIQGDFKILLAIITLIAMLTSSVVIIVFSDNFSSVESFYLVIFSTLMTIRSYLLVYYRLTLRFDYLIKQTIFVLIGYVIGSILFFVTRQWVLIFVFGELLGTIYIIGTTEFIKETNNKTVMFKNTNKMFVKLSVSNIASSSLTYMDRLIIYPILGATNVTLAFTASIVGKMISLISGPISSVLLTYIVKIKKNKIRKSYVYIIGIICIISIVVYIPLISITPIIIKILYPTMADATKPYYMIANLVVVLQLIYSIVRPLSIRFCHVNWQIIVQSIGVAIYILTAVPLMAKNGLSGFFYSSIITQVFLCFSSIILVGINLNKNC